MNKRLKKLNKKLAHIGDSFVRINSGGCAEMAIMLANALTDKVEDTKIVCCGGSGSIDEARELICDSHKYSWNEESVYFDHVWLEIEVDSEWYAVDSTGVHTRKRMYRDWETPSEGSFTLEEIKGLAAEDTWNYIFNRHQLPKMQKMVDRDIAPIAI